MRSFAALALVFAAVGLTSATPNRRPESSCGFLDTYRCDSDYGFSKCDNAGWVPFQCPSGTRCDISVWQQYGWSPCVNDYSKSYQSSGDSYDGGYKSDNKAYLERRSASPSYSSYSYNPGYNSYSGYNNHNSYNDGYHGSNNYGYSSSGNYGHRSYNGYLQRRTASPEEV